jgi:hypothetical protein
MIQERRRFKIKKIKLNGILFFHFTIFSTYFLCPFHTHFVNISECILLFFSPIIFYIILSTLLKLFVLGLVVRVYYIFF